MERDAARSSVCVGQGVVRNAYYILFCHFSFLRWLFFRPLHFGQQTVIYYIIIEGSFAIFFFFLSILPFNLRNTWRQLTASCCISLLAVSVAQMNTDLAPKMHTHCYVLCAAITTAIMNTLTYLINTRYCFSKMREIVRGSILGLNSQFSHFKLSTDVVLCLCVNIKDKINDATHTLYACF